MSVILKLMTLIDQGTTSYFSSYKSSFTSSSFFRLWLPSSRDALSSIRFKHMCCRNERSKQSFNTATNQIFFQISAFQIENSSHREYTVQVYVFSRWEDMAHGSRLVGYFFPLSRTFHVNSASKQCFQ